jgi:cation diffusion facilitator CzcD-associated flavoprotein CzcO
MEPDRPVIVVGAGPAGIASALALKDSGLAPLVIDQADRIGSSWRSRYDSLRLNTWRRFSQLPGRPFPKGTPTFPSRDQVVEYLERHSAEDGIELWLGTRVERIDRDNGRWVARTSDGDVRAPEVIVATGYEQDPVIPDWPGRADYEGELIHASAYRNAEPFARRSVLVVGSGSSGMEIAHELAVGGAAKVWLAIRTPPNIVLRQGPGPVPGDLIATILWHLPIGLANRIARFGSRMDFGDLSEYGLPAPEDGVFTRARRDGRAPAIVDAEVIEAIKDGRIEVVAAVDSLDPSGVQLADGSRVEPDAVICATGYRRGLEPLVGHLGVLDQKGVPTAIGPSAAAEGLRFIGYVPRPGGLGYMGKEARRAARAVRRELKREPVAATADLTNTFPPSDESRAESLS